MEQIVITFDNNPLVIDGRVNVRIIKGGESMESKNMVLKINIKGLDRLNELLQEIENLEFEVEVDHPDEQEEKIWRT